MATEGITRSCNDGITSEQVEAWLKERRNAGDKMAYHALVLIHSLEGECRAHAASRDQWAADWEESDKRVKELESLVGM